MVLDTLTVIHVSLMAQNQIAFPAFIECNIDVNYSSFDEERKLREKIISGK